MSNTQATQPVGPFDDFVVRRPEDECQEAKNFVVVNRSAVGRSRTLTHQIPYK